MLFKEILNSTNITFQTRALNMSGSSPLDEWKFLVGTWKGKTEASQFGQKGIIEGLVTFSCEPSALFIMGTGENRSEGKLLHKRISILFYDNVEKNSDAKQSSPTGSSTTK